MYALDGMPSCFLPPPLKESSGLFIFSENFLFIIHGIESVAINKTRESRLPIVNDLRSHDSGAINDRMEFSVICKSSLTLHYKRNRVATFLFK